MLRSVDSSCMCPWCMAACHHFLHLVALNLAAVARAISSSPIGVHAVIC